MVSITSLSWGINSWYIGDRWVGYRWVGNWIYELFLYQAFVFHPAAKDNDAFLKLRSLEEEMSSESLCMRVAERDMNSVTYCEFLRHCSQHTPILTTKPLTP